MFLASQTNSLATEHPGKPPSAVWQVPSGVWGWGLYIHKRNTGMSPTGYNVSPTEDGLNEGAEIQLFT